MLFTKSSNNFYSAGCEIYSHLAKIIISCTLLGTSFTQYSFAQTETELSSKSKSVGPELTLCPAPKEGEIKYIKPRAFSAEKIGNTEISADNTESSSDGTSSLYGNVVIERHLLRISSDLANYDKKKNLLSVSGNVSINSESLSLKADQGTVEMAVDNNQDSNLATFEDIQFIVPESNMKGKARTITTNQHKKNGNKQSTLNNANITSCSLLDPDWLISADELWLDHDDEYGSADDVVIRFKDIPFMYTPYIEFPTSDRRRSGLLFPSLSTSSSRGVELSVPWYWNIATNHDAVIEPRYMTERGLELGSTYRYLTKSSNGILDGEYLHEDDITKEKRYQVRYQQNSRLMSDLLLDINFRDISDADYFNDFSDNLTNTSQTHLNRNATLNYNLGDWQLRAMVQDIKTIDDTSDLNSRPYVRLPQITFIGDTELADSSVFFTLDSEYVDFTHESNTVVTGSRATVRPGLRLSLGGSFWFMEPAVKFSHTQYDVGSEAGTGTPVDDRNLPISSIDAGLFFERDLKGGFQQTLEPRLYYLNVPFEDQSNTPLFDTSIPNFSVAQLFRDNRFVGGDRVGDANQLTVALTSRVLKTSSGDEFLRASIGQIFYFEDRKISLDGTIDTTKQSDVIAELDINWNHWQSNIDLQWDTTHDELSQENYFLHYKSDDRNLFNIGYRKRLKDRDIDIEQTDTSFVYALNDNYTGIARWNYSLKDNKNINIIAGISYDSCCWSIQLLGQRRLKNTTETTTANDDNYDNSILIQFVFKGLGSLAGNKAKLTLKDAVYGYNDVLQ